VGNDVAYIGYSILYGIARYTTKIIVLQLFSKNLSEASGIDAREEFILSC
jgi:hypothetical protein